MKVSVLLSIARQVDGEFVFIKGLLANVDPDKLYKYLRQNDLPTTEKIGEVECVIEYGIIEDIEISQE